MKKSLLITNKLNAMDAVATAKFLGICVRKLSEITISGDVPSYKIGNAYFFVEVEVDAWLETQRFTPLPLPSAPIKISLLKKAG